MRQNLLVRIIFTIILLLTMILVPTAPVSAADVNLKSAAMGTDTSAVTSAAGWVDVGTAPANTANVNGSTSAGDKILVVASFHAEETVSMLGSFRIRNNAGTPILSSEFVRELSVVKANDTGIGSIVHIFTATDGTDDSFTLQHSTTAGTMTTAATIVAIPLATSEGSLPYGEFTRTDPDAVNGTTWEEVGDDISTPTTCRTGAVTLGNNAHIYVAASIETEQDGGGNDTGSWKLQYSTDSNFDSDVRELGTTMMRYLSGNGDIGLSGLVGLAQNQPSGPYYFRVMHYGEDTSVTTNKVSLVAVGLEDGSHYLQAWGKTLASDTTQSTSLEGVTGGSVTFTPDVSSSDLFMHAVFQMGATKTSLSTYDISLDGYSTQDEHRFISSATDVGAGNSAGLTSITNTEYTLSLNHSISDGAETLTTSNVSLVGFAMGYDTETPPIPEWPTYLLVGSGMVLVVVYFWFRRDRAIATNSR
ncbi:hypothetical protein ACFLWF_00410 [Chloroflexota bacterium]